MKTTIGLALILISFAACGVKAPPLAPEEDDGQTSELAATGTTAPTGTGAPAR